MTSGPDTASDPGDAAAGILVYASPNVDIESNQVTNTQFGIAVVSAASGAEDHTTVRSNSVNATHIFDAVDVCSNNNVILTVEIIGTVPSIERYLRDAAVVVVPLRIGGGTRLKIYESMAMGKAMVSTRLGAEGLDVRHERDILLADDPQRFAEHVVRFLRDDETRRKYEAAAAATVQKYDWSVITERLLEALHIAIGVGSHERVVSMQVAASA